MELSLARGILIVVDIQRIGFDFAIMDIGLHLSSATLVSSVRSLITKIFYIFEIVDKDIISSKNRCVVHFLLNKI